MKFKHKSDIDVPKRKMYFFMLVILIIIAIFVFFFIKCSAEKIDPIATIIMEDGSEIVIKLYPDKAPNTVRNFVLLIKDGFYNDLIFHRVIPKFMIQGGSPDGNGIGGPGYNIKGEFSSNGIKNDLLHTRGVISMARSKEYDSGGSQFFILVEDSPHLDGEYAAFGKVLKGMDIVDNIALSKRDKNNKPLVDQKIKTIYVENADNIHKLKENWTLIKE